MAEEGEEERERGGGGEVEGARESSPCAYGEVHDDDDGEGGEGVMNGGCQ